MVLFKDMCSVCIFKLLSTLPLCYLVYRNTINKLTATNPDRSKKWLRHCSQHKEKRTVTKRLGYMSSRLDVVGIFMIADNCTKTRVNTY